MDTNIELFYLILGTFSGFIRNLIFLSIIFNNFDVLLHLLIFNETILMTAFWIVSSESHITTFFTNSFTSSFDLFNLLRVSLISPSSDPHTLPVLSLYSMNSNLLEIITGELFVLGFLLIFSVVIRGASIWINSEKIRNLNSTLRPRWNGLIFVMMPRLATHSALQLRNLYEATVGIILNGILSCLLIVGLIGFWVALVLQTKQIHKNIEQIS